MTVVCGLRPLLVLLLIFHVCSPEPHQPQAVRRLSNSIHLTRRMRTRVQALLLQYKIQELGDSKFEDRSLVLHSLPSVDIHYMIWLHMKDSERLSKAIRDLQCFRAHLDVKMQQMLEERKGRANKLTRSMYNTQLDIRDLIHLIKAQLSQVEHGDHAPPRDEFVSEQPLLTVRLAWHRHLQGYVVLRDLERFLGRLVRDLTLLKAKHRRQ